nr:hypothetical protein [Shewanella shenzhenensis]
MTFTESVTLLLALLYGASQLWWAGKRFGFIVALLSIAAALIIASSFTLLIGTACGAILLALLHWWQPARVEGQVRINQ